MMRESSRDRADVPFSGKTHGFGTPASKRQNWARLRGNYLNFFRRSFLMRATSPSLCPVAALSSTSYNKALF
jgi:hypothetical protein